MRMGFVPTAIDRQKPFSQMIDVGIKAEAAPSIRVDNQK